MIFRPTKIPRHVERLISVPYVGFSFWDRGGQRDDRFCQHRPRRSWIQLLCAGSICSFVTQTFHVPWGAQPPIVVQCNVPSVLVPARAIHLSGRLRVGAPAPSLTLRRTVGRTRAAQQSPRSASASRRRRYKQERCLDLRLLPDWWACAMELPWVSLAKCRPCSRAAEDGHGAESSFTGPEPEDLPPQPLWSPRWICSLCRRSVSGSSVRSLILHHDVDASYQWRSHPNREAVYGDVVRPRLAAHYPSAASGATKASAPKPATSSRHLRLVHRRASTRRTSRRRRRCWRS
jgi:hypothetical protein